MLFSETWLYQGIVFVVLSGCVNIFVETSLVSIRILVSFAIELWRIQVRYALWFKVL